MNKIFILIILFLSLSSAGNAQWKRVTSIPAPYDNAYYLEIYFLDSNPQYGWACGRSGVVIRTTNGGDSWDVAVIPNAIN